MQGKMFQNITKMDVVARIRLCIPSVKIVCMLNLIQLSKSPMSLVNLLRRIPLLLWS